MVVFIPVLVFTFMLPQALAPENESLYAFCPPVTKRRRTASGKCFVSEYGIDIGKPCSSESVVQRLSDTTANSVVDITGVTGVENEADLILSRAGIFDWRQQPLSQLSVCNSHYAILGRRFSRDRPALKRGSKRILKCAAPDIPDAGLQHAGGTTVAKGGYYITKEQAQVLMEKHGILARVGDGTSVSILSKITPL